MGLLAKLFGKKKKQEEKQEDQVLARKAEKEEQIEDTKPITLDEVQGDIRTIDAMEPSRIASEKPKRQKIYAAEDTPDEAKDMLEDDIVEEDMPKASMTPEKEVVEEETPIVEEDEEKLYDIKKHPKGWQIIAQDAERAYRVFDTQKEAIDFAKENDLEVTIYKADGTPRK
ncbi:MAG: DUF2188 domain-containing protein [Candidatus Izemoplasmataceae bacterium]